MIDQAKEKIKAYAQTAGQKADEVTDSVCENEKVQAASQKVRDVAEAVAQNPTVQAAGQKVQQAAETVVQSDLIQKAADNELIQAASRKVQEAAQAIAENELLQAAAHKVQDKAQKLGAISEDEYKELFEKTNLVPTEKEKEKGAVNLEGDPKVVTGETQPETNKDLEKEIKQMKDMTKG
ncbi:hypothetical protein FisN_2Hh106 [Fistulifera solaris]|jgi:hypothetical protein|uniref:Uncharacterized protein n=1 Tax=Fistulifera solaris TaxID=1519565 RepID=A0A1Z5KP74_FISSO|nr:hypothetical protein FisN_2Hh106 [Fistulifera solaris]|eukprot:GAX28076.1 hypothetical protein FisN_2Hh106 [Fistulifera solaris]